MRLQLGLWDWPPVASHLLCFFLGIVLVNLGRRPEADPLVFRVGKIYVALPERLQNDAKRARSQGFYFGKKLKEGRLCRLAGKPLKPLENNPAGLAVLAFELSADGINTASYLVRQPLPAIITAQDKVPPCIELPRLSFG